jgi:MerR family transcriptional regulator, copper efflux regulator
MNHNVRLPLLTLPDDGHGAVPAVPPSQPSRPEEPLMQVGDLARESGKSIRAIHLYEELDLLRPAARSKGRFRLYGAEALVRIRWIGKLQDLGFSLPDIKEVVKDWEQAQHVGSAPAAMTNIRALYRHKLQETRLQIQRLRALEHELEASVDYLETCEVCDPARLVTACQRCDRHERGETPPELVAGFSAQPS